MSEHKRHSFVLNITLALEPLTAGLRIHAHRRIRTYALRMPGCKPNDVFGFTLCLVVIIINSDTIPYNFL